MDELGTYLERIASALEAIEAQNRDIVMNLEQIRKELNWIDPLSATWNIKSEIEDIKASLESGLPDLLGCLQGIEQNTNSF